MVETLVVIERPGVPHPIVLEPERHPLTPDDAIDEVNERWKRRKTTTTGMVIMVV